MVGTLSSNWLFDNADKYVKPPDIKDLRVKNPDDYIQRLDEITAPKERLKKLFISTIDPTNEPTYEAFWIRRFAMVGFAGGFFAGFFFNTADIHQDYVRKHNSSVFDSKYVGNRHFWDTLVYRGSGRGFRYGIRSALVATAAATIGTCSVVYRDKLHYPDWLIGYPLLGALSRLWLGPRAMAAGAGIWLVLGSFSYGMFRLLEKATGISVSELEYHSHVDHLNKLQYKLNRNHVVREDLLMQQVKSSFSPTSGR